MASSDHSALWVDQFPQASPLSRKARKRIRFKTVWTKTEECKEVITESWNEDAQENFITKIRGCRVKLLWWNKEVFGNVGQQCRTLDEQICALKKKKLNANNNRQMAYLRTKFKHLTYQEELLWKQRAKTLWLKEGDKNTAFFMLKQLSVGLRKRSNL
ncbi:UNVERIFIED_CONTAM: hypothetical protein Sangu_2006100 [Sesamum angustifolium]|uniref:Uncharacterized protein n=1 Tax=Sesamum angustifolium TaxID=2727405 RepID=A0AAW2LH89_9LAMI